jgi:hypothetical protein
METKRCSKCRETKPLSEFYRTKRTKDGLAYYCKACHILACKETRDRHPETHRAATQRYRERHPGKGRDHALSYRYGLAVGEYDTMLARQGGGCAICGATTARSHQTRLHVDHCKITKKVRGLLCGSCNNGLGQFKHDTDLMYEAIGYLVRNTD